VFFVVVASLIGVAVGIFELFAVGIVVELSVWRIVAALVDKLSTGGVVDVMVVVVSALVWLSVVNEVCMELNA
jgi:hypothetical protein